MSEAPKKVTIHGGSNMAYIEEEVAKGIEKTRKHKNNRQSENDELRAIKAHLETLGIRKEAFVMAIQYLEWDEDKRQGFDLAYSIVRKVGGSPIRLDLVGLADRDQIADQKNVLRLVLDKGMTPEIKAQIKALLELPSGEDGPSPVHGDGSAVNMKSSPDAGNNNGKSRPLTGLAKAVAESDAAVAASVAKHEEKKSNAS
jgi:hypothetical protein